MPLVTSKEVLQQALAERFAVGAFNINNMEIVQAIVEAAQEERAPVIVQVSQGAIRYAGLDFAAGLVKIAADQVGVPVVLHLDHGTSFEQNVLCLRAGIAEGIVSAAKEMSISVPLVVRLEGTNVDLGKQILQESGLAIIPADDLGDAAQKIVAEVKQKAA